MDLCLSPAETPAVNYVLTPAQQVVAEAMLSGLACGQVVVLRGDVGQGKTTVLKHVETQTGGAYLGSRAPRLPRAVRQKLSLEGRA